ncbi:BRO family protein [Bacillus thuringiensis]
MTNTNTNQLQRMFNYAGKQVRTVVRDGEPWFVAKDVCDILDIKQVVRAVDKLDEDEVTTIHITDNLGRLQNTYIINEAGLYMVMLKSRKPEAKAFKRWITHDVIPSIRKHGAYMTENALEQAINDPDFMIGLLKSLKEEKAKRIEVEKENTVLTLELEEAKPKADKYEAFLDAEGLTTFTIVGKQFLGGMSAVAVRKFLQAEGVLFNRRVDGVYAPTHGFEHYFRITPYTRPSYDSPKIVGRSLKVTNRGIDFIVDLYDRRVNRIPS